MRTLRFIFPYLFLLLGSMNLQADTILHNLQGEDIALSSLKGKWVFINYWASWCQPCLDEIAELNRFYENNKQKNVAVFAINYDAVPQNVQKRLIKQFDIRYPSLKHASAQALNLGNITAVPVTFVFNPQGELSATLYGGQTFTSLKRVIAAN